MKDLIKRHYKAIIDRGFISHKTTPVEFMDKITEEYYEVMNAYEDHGLCHEAIHETVDLIATCINMLTHNGVDFVEEFRKNVEYQENRK